MTIDTEGSEVDLVEDFPWHRFAVRVVQIEQLDERRYSAQRGKKARIIKHMTASGYRLLETYTVAQMDTEDLIFALDRAGGAESSPLRVAPPQHAANPVTSPRVDTPSPAALHAAQMHAAFAHNTSAMRPTTIAALARSQAARAAFMNGRHPGGQVAHAGR